MKKIILTLLMCLVCVSAQADLDITTKDINSFEKTVNTNKVLIGDAKDKAKFKAKAELNVFDNEDKISIEYVGDFSPASVVDKKVKADGIDESIEMYFIDEKTFEFEVIFKKRPAKDSFNFEIEGWEDFDFFYQDTLENDYKNGMDVMPEDSTLQKYLDRHTRSENVIGSYAVYHKTKRNHVIGKTNYKTGKAFHIYRPKFIDADLKEVWADMSFSNGILTIKGNKKWLDKAKYPVILDPTVGYDTLGSSSGYAGAEDKARCTKGTASASGTISKGYIGGLLDYSWSYCDFAIYNDSGGDPSTKLVETDSIAGDTGDGGIRWIPAPSPDGFTGLTGSSVVSGNDYWVCGNMNEQYSKVAYDSTAATTAYKAMTHGTWDASFGAHTDGTAGYSAYFEFTESAPPAAAASTGRRAGFIN